MHFNAIGIYDNACRQIGEIKKINFSQKSKPGLFNPNPNDLELLEKKSLFKLPFEMETNGFYKLIEPNEYHYFKLASDRSSVMSIVSRIEIDNKELFYLFTNIHHAHVRSESINLTLKKILDNPLGYINRDVQPDKISEELNNVKDIMFKNIELIIQRGEKIDSLVDKTEGLKIDSEHFRIASKKVKDSYKCCRIM